MDVEEARVLTRKAAALREAGLPVKGVKTDGTIAWSVNPSQAQITQATAVIAGLDLRPRRKRKFADVAAQVNALAAADERKLRLGMMTQFVIDNPAFAKRLGIAIDGDEPIP